MPPLNIKTGDLLAADFYIIYLQPIRAIIESISMLKTGGEMLVINVEGVLSLDLFLGGHEFKYDTLEQSPESQTASSRVLV